MLYLKAGLLAKVPRLYPSVHPPLCNLCGVGLGKGLGFRLGLRVDELGCYA